MYLAGYFNDEEQRMENDVFVEGAIDPSDRAVFPRYALTVNRFIMGEIGLFASVGTARCVPKVHES